MARHVHVMDTHGKVLSTYPIELGTDEAEIREEEYFEAARRRAKDENLVEDDAMVDALRFQFATGPR
jgi:hypothetical protein